MAHMFHSEARIQVQRALDTVMVVRPDNDVIDQEARELALMAKRLHTVDLAACNGIPDGFYDNGQPKRRWNETDEANAEETRKRCLARAQAAVRSLFGNEAHRVTLEYNADPRGAPLTIDMVDGEPRIATFY